MLSWNGLRLELKGPGLVLGFKGSTRLNEIFIKAQKLKVNGLEMKIR